MKKRKCRHVWSSPDPQPNEAYCRECGTLFTGSRGQITKPKAPPANLLAEVAAGMAGMGPEPDIQNVGEPIPFKVSSGRGVPAEIVTPRAPAPTWCRMAGKNIAKAYVMLVEGACARFAKRKVADPEDEDVTELGVALGEQMAIWFPDSEMTPATKMAIAAASVTATMVVGSTPIRPPAKLASIPQPIPVAAPTAETQLEFETPAPSNVTIPRGLF
jgi:hypothetical protein